MVAVNTCFKIGAETIDITGWPVVVHDRLVIDGNGKVPVRVRRPFHLDIKLIPAILLNRCAEVVLSSRHAVFVVAIDRQLTGLGTNQKAIITQFNPEVGATADFIQMTIWRGMPLRNQSAHIVVLPLVSDQAL